MVKGEENIRLDFCLLIPCYNNLEGLILSIRSVNYPPERFIVVAVDDGSDTPVTVSVIEETLKNGYEIVVLRNDQNRGITNALNKGLEWIVENTDSKYIARLDCADRCRNDRFLKQVDYLDKHPETGLLGSWCEFENRKLTKYTYKTPTDHEAILKAMHFKNVFIHPTVMFRKEWLERSGYYPSGFPYAEDYAFFWQLVKMGHCHILGEFLVVCEINNEGISLKNRRKQFLSRIKVISRYGTNPFFKLAGILKIIALSLIPKQLAMHLKNLRKD